MTLDQNELDMLQEIVGAWLLDFPDDLQAAAFLDRVNKELE